MLFTEPTFLFVFLPLLLALVPTAGGALPQLAAAGGEHHFLHARRRQLHLARPRADRLQLRRRASSSTATAPRALGRRLLAGAVAINLLVLAVVQVRGFRGGQRQRCAARSSALSRSRCPASLLPIGISFFTFHAISYVVDVYRGDAAAQKQPGRRGALPAAVSRSSIAGPIIRYREIADQLAARASSSLDDFAYGVRRFVIGLGKKMLIANTLAAPADQIFALPAAELTAAHAWLGDRRATRCRSTSTSPATPTWRSASAACSASASPRTSTARTSPTSIQDFWRRWHISLSTWFRDYLYIPLGGNRASTGADATSTSYSCSSCAACGTARAGPSSSGASSTARSSCSSASGSAARARRAAGAAARTPTRCSS